MEKQFIDEKYKNLSEEYKKDKDEFKQTVDSYNNMLIENKLKLKSNDEKIKYFEAEKKIKKENKTRYPRFPTRCSLDENKWGTKIKRW